MRFAVVACNAARGWRAPRPVTGAATTALSFVCSRVQVDPPRISGEEKDAAPGAARLALPVLPGLPGTPRHIRNIHRISTA